MNPIVHLATSGPLIALHLAAALLALLVGAAVLLRRKGTVNHTRLGWFWVALMAVTAASTLFIRDRSMLNIAGYTPIHLFSVFVAYQLPMAVVNIRRGDVVAHRKRMKGLFWGACVTAGVFTLLPQRFLGGLLWRNLLGVVS